MRLAQPRHLARPRDAGSKTCGGIVLGATMERIQAPKNPMPAGGKTLPSTRATISGVEPEWLLEGNRGDCLAYRGRWSLARLLEPQLPRQLEIATAGVRELHLPGRPAFRLEQQGTPHDDAGALRPRSCDVEAVEAVEELHAVRSVRGARRRHGIDDQRSLLPLEPIHRAHPRIRKPRAHV